jgi:3-hexulose-6-phosphate synthase
MLLQLAIDRAESISIVPQVADLIDILEVGTPTLKRLGLAAIATVRELAPGVPVLADTKTVDGGEQEAEMVFSAGATFMSVLAFAGPATLAATLEVAAKHGTYVVVDAFDDEGQKRVETAGVPDACAYVVSHAPSDAPLAGDRQAAAHMNMVARFHERGYRVMLAGGIDKSNLARAVRAEPEVLVVGRAVAGATNPRRAIEWILHQLPDRGRGWPWEPR